MKKYIAFILFLCIAAGIFALTLQSAEGTSVLTASVLEKISGLLRKAGVPEEKISAAWWNNGRNIRKAAHTAEYFLLGVAAGILFKHRNNQILKAFLLCALISFADQCVKGLLPTREFDWTDFPFDIAGYAMGIIFTAAVGKVRSFLQTRL